MLASEKLFFSEEPVMRNALTKFASLSAILLVSAACTTKVEVATKEPITINLNVKIQHEIRVKVDKELEDVFKKDKGLF